MIFCWLRERLNQDDIGTNNKTVLAVVHSTVYICLIEIQLCGIVFALQITSFIFIIKPLLAGYRSIKAACCVELLKFDLGLKALLSLHDDIDHLIPIIVPFFDSSEVSGSAFVINKERTLHYQ